MQSNTAEIVEYVTKNSTDAIADLLKYAPHDTLLFWSDKKELNTLQKQLWLPFINWANAQTSAEYNYSEDLYTKNTLNQAVNLKKYLENLDKNKLAVTYIAAKELLSVILGLAFAHKICSVDEAIDSAFLEQKFQEQKWGEDEFETAKYLAVRNRLNHLKTLL